MNTYAKYCANVFVAKCTEPHQKGEVINVKTKYGKENPSIVFNLVAQKDGFYYYSIVREDGFNTQEWAKRKAERLNRAAEKAKAKSDAAWEKSKKDHDFLSLGEPIKVGHHSEKRHRKIIQQSHDNMDKFVKYGDESKEYSERAKYWEGKENTINLSMPESIEYYEFLVEKKRQIHQGLKSGELAKSHSFSLTYAKKELNQAEANLKTAIILWGDN